MSKIVAKWNGEIIAEVDKDKALVIEGNYYLPKSAIKSDYYTDSTFQTHCPWKGDAHYFNVVVNGETNANAAWYYPNPKPGSAEVVSDQNEGKYEGNFKDFVAFWNGVVVDEE